MSIIVVACMLMSDSLPTLWTVAHQATPSMRFSRQEYWSGLPFLPPGDLHDLRTEPTSPVAPALAGRFFTTEPPRKAMNITPSHNFHLPIL